MTVNKILFKKNTDKIFIYDNFIDEIINSSQKNYLLFGGRGSGKTTVLENAKKYFSENELLYYSENNIAEFLKYLTDVKNDASFKEVNLIIDNIDLIAKHIIENKLDDGINYVKKISILCSKITDNNKLVLLSSYMFPECLSAIINESLKSSAEPWSEFLASFSPIILTPWNYFENWNVSLKNITLSVLNKITDKSEFRNDNIINSFEIWWNIIIDLTGGHPALFSCAIYVFLDLVTKYEVLPEHQRCLLLIDMNIEKIKDLIITEITNETIHYIRKAIRSVKNAKERIYKDAYMVLLKIANNGDIDNILNIKYIERFLLKECLIYIDKNGKHVIPGSIIRDHIIISSNSDMFKTLDNNMSKRNTIEIRADHTEPNMKGSLIINTTDILLKGNAWKILQYLFDNRNKVCTLEEIAGATDINSGSGYSAVSSAIKRLMDKISPSENEGYKIITNKRGRGYVLNDN